MSDSAQLRGYDQEKYLKSGILRSIFKAKPFSGGAWVVLCRKVPVNHLNIKDYAVLLL